MSVTDYAASGNTSVGGINIATGCSPANVDNALRKIVDDIGEGLANGYFATALPATKTANYTVLTTDRGKLFNCTSALTLALPAAATAAAGFMFWVKANGAAVILDPNAAELIDGAATVTIASGSSAFVVCTGTAWVTAFVATSYDEAAADARYAQLSGASFSGALSVFYAYPTITMGSSGSGHYNLIVGKVGAYQRWQLMIGNGDPESGSDTGSNFGLYRFSDAGAYLGDSIVISRSDGAIYVENGNRVHHDGNAARYGAPDAILEDQKAANTAGGTATSGSWETRVLNTEVSDPAGLVSLSSNQFTVTANGWVEWTAPGWAVNNHKTRLYNVTDSVVVAEGESGFGQAAAFGLSRSGGGGAVVAGKTYRIENRVQTTTAGAGMGTANNFGGAEVYTRVKFWRS